MKITLDNQPRAEFQFMNQVKTGSTANVKINQLSNNIVSNLNDNKTYEGRKMSVEDFKNNLEAIDLSVTQDAMTVASNTMSQEDFNEMMKEGKSPLEMDVKDTVTILDKIKLYVAKGGTEVEGFTDTLDAETIEKITGSRTITGNETVESFDVEIDDDLVEAIASEYEKIKDIDSINDGMKVYLMASGKDVTFENLYLAKHSATGEAKEQGSSYFGIETKGYLAKKADNVTDEELKGEVIDLLQKMGIEVTDENISNGIWLVKNSMRVSPENIKRLEKINEVSLPISKEDFAKIVLSALNKGVSVDKAIVTENSNIYKEAIKITGEINEVLDSEFVTKTRIMEETRLKMTLEANLMLLKSGVNIDTKYLERYVEELKKLEKTPEYQEAYKMTEVSEAISDIKEAPAAMLATWSTTIDLKTLSELRKEGNEAGVKFKEVETKYEQVWTEVRKDLGDSIKKAFRNVDDILNELNLPKTDENRRAVRILGYNTMAITTENIDEIREADRKLQSVISRLTPADTLSLIRKGSSPIEMSIKELNEYLDTKEDETKEEIEKYSKFLFKLDKSNEITASERESFIEVYRFMYQMEKTDLAAIGSVLATGKELTIANLKTAMASSKHKGMDVKIDESFGFLVSDIRSEIEPEKLSRIDFTDDLELDVMYEKLREEARDKNLEDMWAKEKFAEMKEALKAPEEVVNELLMNRISVTAENLEAMHGLMKQKGAAFRRVLETRDEEFIKEADEMLGSLASKEEAQSKYGEMIDTAQNVVLKETLMQDSYIDVKALRLVNLELSTAKNLAESETYEVPVEIGGELTSINVKVVHNLTEEPNVVINFETDNLGRVNARLTVENEEIEGYIACNLKETLTKIEKVADKVSNKVKAIHSDNLRSDGRFAKIPMRDNSDEVSTTQLYKVAKRFMEALKGIDNEN